MLSIYLFSQETRSFDDMMREVEAGEPGPERIPAGDLGFPHRLYRTASTSNEPGWSAYLNEHFDVSWTQSITYSAVLLVHVDGRFLAVTFGHAASLLRTELLVNDFGKRVSGNGISKGGLRSLGSRTIGGAPMRRSRQGLNRPGFEHDFRFDLGSELVRGIGGDSEVDFAKRMYGDEALKIEPTGQFATLDRLGELIARVLECYEPTTYREKFSFIDDYTLVQPYSHLARALDRDLVVRVQNNDWDGIATAAPEALADVTFAVDTSFRIRGDNRRRPAIDEVTLTAVRDAVRAVGSDEAFKRLKVAVVGPGGREHHVRPLYDYLTAEVDRGNSHFVLCDGHWYEIGAAGRSRVERQLTTITELEPQVMCFDTLLVGEHETSYNARIASGRDWLNMERHRVTLADRYGRIEVCDLLTPDMKFICVKKLDRSSTLSHLFAQGSVSARLFHDDESLYSAAETYADYILRQHGIRWPGSASEEHRRMIVYAIATTRAAPIRDQLPYFSKANLVHHAQLVRNSGFDVALAHVPRAASAVPSMRAPGVRGGIRPEALRRAPGPGQFRLFES